MLKIIDPDNIKLNNKMFSIHVTNVCNLHCGGCDQFCGYFNKEKHFFISIQELKDAIECFKAYRANHWTREDFPEDEKLFLLYGGEPTLHPKFDEIKSILLEHKDIPFVIYTNGRSFPLAEIDISVSSKDVSRQVYLCDKLPKTGYPEFLQIFQRFHTHDKNIAYRIDYKTSQSCGDFVPTMVAPVDIEENPLSKKDYWLRAKSQCYKWNMCENSIYNGKAYVCNVAATMDHMFYQGQHGWEVKAGENPFEKNTQQIAQQMENFCYRCGYNCKGGLKGFDETMETTQYIQKGSMITQTNLAAIDKNSVQFVQLDIITPPEKKVPKEVFR